MIVLGIDPGSRSAGWGVIVARGEQFTHVDHGLILAGSSATLDLGGRLVLIGNAISNVLAKHTPDLVALEAGIIVVDKANSGRKRGAQQGALSLAEARGVVRFLAACERIPIVELQNSTIKLAVAGHGRAEKTLVKRFVVALLHMIAAPPDDASDALATAIAAARRAASDRFLSISTSRARAAGAR